MLFEDAHTFLLSYKPHAREEQCYFIHTSFLFCEEQNTKQQKTKTSLTSDDVTNDKGQILRVKNPQTVYSASWSGPDPDLGWIWADWGTHTFTLLYIASCVAPADLGKYWLSFSSVVSSGVEKRLPCNNPQCS